MTTVKATTKKGQALVNSAKHSRGFYLDEVYKSYSQAKRNAWAWCLARCEEEEGSNFRIISANSQTFSVAWNSPKGVRIETAYNSYLIPDATF